ncbi:MAG: NifU family protein [Acidimicrobiales bacterium]
MQADVDSALAGIRSIIQADGGDIRLVDVDGAKVTLELVLDSAECRECVMPRAYLEPMALDMLRAAVPAVREVTIADPREADGT